ADASFRIVPRRVVAGPLPRVKMLLWGHVLDRTGAPLHQLELASALRERGVIEPRVIATIDGPLRADYERLGVPLRLCSHPLEGVGDAEYDAAVERLGREMAGDGASLVCANTLETFFAIDAASRAGLPSLWNVHEAEGDRYFAGWPDWLARRARRCFALAYRV